MRSAPPTHPPLADTTAVPALPAAPRIALVLGSGGVRSVAAIGIVDRLAREGIRPDVIVGCSSGALFGATIAMGASPGEALEMATSLWTAELTRQKRWRAWAQLIAPRWTGFGPGFALRDNRLIAERLRSAFGNLRLEDLAIPLRVVATVAATGRRVVLTRGSVVEALLATMAVPLIFPSVLVENCRLVDGVVSDPLPVSVASDARVAIALGFFGAVPRHPHNAGRMVAQASTALINNLMQARLDAAQASGQRIVSLQLATRGRIGLWETAAMPALCEAGRAAAENGLPSLWDALHSSDRRLVA